MAGNIPDDKLYQFAQRINKQTVVITGAASGIGRASALQFAKYGANVVIGDINLKGAQQVVEEIIAAGGKAICQSCNVLDFDSQINLFELAISTFGKVDVVIPNAGTSESQSRITDFKLDERGRPLKPDLFCLHLNYDSAVYTAHLAMYYFSKNQDTASLKSIVMTASILGFTAIPGAAEYCASKHGIIGFIRAISPVWEPRGIRIVSVCPWFVDTPLVPEHTKIILTNIPMAPVERVAGAVFLAATDLREVEVKTEKEEITKISTNGAAYTIPDDREVYRIPHTLINEGVYALLSNRVKNWSLSGKMITMHTILSYTKLFLKDLSGPMFMGIGIAFSAYQIMSKIQSKISIQSVYKLLNGKS